MKRALLALFLMSVVGSMSAILYAQEADTPVPDAEPAEEKIAPEQEKQSVPVSGKAAAKPSKTGNAPKADSQNANAAGSDSLSLLETSEGDFRSVRIPGITFEKKDFVEAGKTEAIQGDDKGQVVKKGALKRMLPLLTVVGIIVFIVLVYRIGRRKRKGSVFRRFP